MRTRQARIGSAIFFKDCEPISSKVLSTLPRICRWASSEMQIPPGSGRQRNLPVYFAARIFAFNAAATRLTGGRPISPLTTLVAATSFAISTPVAMPMPSSM